MSAGEAPVIFATYAAHPEITDDDAHFVAALERRGVPVRGVSWDADEDWRRGRAVVVRSTWDYHHRAADFLRWIDVAAAATAVHNDPRILRWNAHKGYLAALAARGIPVIDTVFVARGDACDVASIARAHRWSSLVVKPAVSASAHDTHRFASSDAGGAQQHLQAILARGDAMLQPYVQSLEDRGELSLLFAGGEHTHAVRRRSALAESQTMPGAARTGAPAAAIALARRVIETAGTLAGVAEPPLYARVDLAEDDAIGYRLLELELVEPSLFLVLAEEAADRYAEVLVGRLGRAVNH